MKWVTWQHVGVDRMACAWLIRKRIDPQAEFLFVPLGEQALPPDAEPFDLPGVRLSHRGGHCSFHTLLHEYGLNDPVLERIARIIDEADVVQEVAVEPIAPGLDFVCRGLRLTSPDDATALERGNLLTRPSMLNCPWRRKGQNRRSSRWINTKSSWTPCVMSPSFAPSPR